MNDDKLRAEFERDCAALGYDCAGNGCGGFNSERTERAFTVYLAGRHNSYEVIHEMANQIEGMESLINEYVDELNELRGALIGKKETRSRLPDGVQTATYAATRLRGAGFMIGAPRRSR